MISPADFAEAALAACLPALAMGTAVSALMGTWARRTDRRLDVVERWFVAEQRAPAATDSDHVLGSEADARDIIARVREIYGQELMGDRFVTIVRQIVGVLPKPAARPSPEQERAVGARQAYAWAADYLDEVRGPNTSAPVDRLLSDLAATLRRRSIPPYQQQGAVNPMVAANMKRPTRLAAAARQALAAYRDIFGPGCWNERDRRAFAELDVALEEASCDAP